MEAFIAGKGPQFCRRLSSGEVSRKLDGGKRTSEGLVKWDHVEGQHILHFAPGRYSDEVLAGGLIHVQESASPQENERLAARMGKLMELARVPALRTLRGSGGAALEFAVTLSRPGSGPGWLAAPVKLPAKRRLPFAPLGPNKAVRPPPACCVEKV